MTPDSRAHVLINDLDNMVVYIEALPAHPRYTDALNAVLRAKDALIAGRSDLHQQDMKERFKKVDDLKLKTDMMSSMSERRVPRPAKTAGPSHEPWRVGSDYFVENDVLPELADKFWEKTLGWYELRPHVESRTLPKVLQMCYTMDRTNDAWTLDLRRCPPELRRYYPSLPMTVSAKVWDETKATIQGWNRDLYFWYADKEHYELRFNARAWHVEEEK